MKLIPAFAAHAALRGLLRLVKAKPGEEHVFVRTMSSSRCHVVRGEDFHVGHPIYLRRWWLIPRNRFFNVYLHQMLRDDDDRALHDHPYINLSLILDGGYVEVLPHGHGSLARKWRAPGSLIARRAVARHRLELPPAEHAPRPGILAHPVSWSLFITGPRVRDWGFHCKSGWVHFRDFVNPDDGGATVGRGCDGPVSIPGTAKQRTEIATEPSL